MSSQKPIRISGHAREMIPRRGATEYEIANSIRTCEWRPAEGGRLECKKNFSCRFVRSSWMRPTRLSS
jgi:hypothetical protein